MLAIKPVRKHKKVMGENRNKKIKILDYIQGVHLPGGLLSADEELRTISVGASIGHGQDSRTSVLQGKVLICKFVTIDRFPTSSVVVCEVTTLEKTMIKHILLNNAEM